MFFFFYTVCFSSTKFALVPLIIGRQLVKLCFFSGDLPLTYIRFRYVYLLANKLIDWCAVATMAGYAFCFCFAISTIPICGFYGQLKNKWVVFPNKAGVKRELLDTVKARKLAYYGHTMRKQRSCLEKEIMQGTMPGARRRGRPRTAWMDNIKTWTGLSVEESIRMTEDRDKWRKYVHGVANPRIEDG